jgi:hypothetical protein
MNYAEVILKYFDLFRLAVLLPIKSQFLKIKGFPWKLKL